MYYPWHLSHLLSLRKSKWVVEMLLATTRLWRCPFGKRMCQDVIKDHFPWWCLDPLDLKELSQGLLIFKSLASFFSNSWFVIRVNLRHPWPSLLLYGSLLSLWRFFILVNCYFQVSFHLKEILYVAKKKKKRQNTVTEPLQEKIPQSIRAVSA